jgi:DNA-binding MarR family transcriptional regulator
MDVAPHSPDDFETKPQEDQVTAILLLLRATQGLRRSLQQRLVRLGADENHWFLLAACRAATGSGPTQIELARRVGISPAQVSVLIEQLRVAGWIETIRSTADRRRQCCRTTASGELRLHALTQCVLPVLELWQGTLSADWTTMLDGLAQSETLTMDGDVGQGPSTSKLDGQSPPTLRRRAA